MIRLPLAVWVLAVAACGGGGDDVDVVAVFEEYGALYCARVYECRPSYPGSDTDFTTSFGASETECAAQYSRPADAMAIQASVDAERIVYDEAASQVCLDWMANVTCTDLWAGSGASPTECEGTWVGQVPTGGSCVIEDDCALVGSMCDGGVCTPGSG